MTSVILWIPGWNCQFTHDHIRKYLPNTDIVVVPIKNSSYQDYENDYFLREYHSDILSMCHDIDTAICKLNTKYDTIILYGHSRGGLAAVLFTLFGANRQKISQLILNDPMFNLGEHTWFIPYYMNLYPPCWNTTFPFITLKPKIDVLKTYGTPNKDFEEMSRILSNSKYKTKQTATFSDQMMNYYEWCRWARTTDLRVDVPTLLMISVHDNTIHSTHAINSAKHICTNLTLIPCHFCPHDVLLFDGILVRKIMAELIPFVEEASPIHTASVMPAPFKPKNNQYILYFPTALMYAVIFNLFFIWYCFAISNET